MIAALIAVALLAPIHAHGEAELEAWLIEWEALHEEIPFVAFLPPRDAAHFDQEGYLDLIYEDMQRRHPCSRLLDTWVEESCRVVRKAQAPAGTSPASQRIAQGVNRGMGSNVEQWRGLVAAYFGAETDLALCIMAGESGGNPNAYNPSTASGLFQIKQFWFDAYGGDPFDPENNTRVAKLVRDGYGWDEWSVYNRGVCG